VKVRTGLAAALVVGVVVGAFVAGSHAPQAFSRADDRGAMGFAHYNVVETEGHNLIVTDNQTNTLYFYTIDKDKTIGSELRLRGTVDLTQVGKPIIRPKHLAEREGK
jgi:hypothetical protein